MSERVYLPNGNTALFTPRYGAHRGFVRVCNRTISGMVVAGQFYPNWEGRNAAIVARRPADTSAFAAFPPAPSV